MIILEATFETSSPDVAKAPEDALPEFCFVGRSNVGKSSALNTLIKRKGLARTSKTPGRTQLLNFFHITIADKPGPGRRTEHLRFCDLPGYGYAKAPPAERKKWSKFTAEYLAKRDQLSAVVLLIDAEVGPQVADHQTLEVLGKGGHDLIVVATKVDRLARTRRGAALDKLAKELGVPRAAVIGFSSHEPIGHQELWTALLAAAGIWKRESDHVIQADASDEESVPPPTPEDE